MKNDTPRDTTPGRRELSTEDLAAVLEVLTGERVLDSPAYRTRHAGSALPRRDTRSSSRHN